MSHVTFQQMLRLSAFDTLGDLYPDDVSSYSLLVRLGASRARLPVRGTRRQKDYWMAICDEIAKGAFVFTLGDLVAEAACDFPHNPDLARLLGAMDSQSDGLAEVEDELRVLCLMASPVGAARLRLDLEQRTIDEVAERWPRIVVTSRQATRTSDIVPALLTVKPRVVHFSGHGAPDGRLIFENDQGLAKPVAPEALAEVFAAVDELLCVVLNSCYTGAQAEAFLGAATSVAGSTAPLADRCAIAFSRGFYQGLGAGRSVRGAYDLGKAEMSLDTCDTSALRYLDRESGRPGVR